MTEDEAVLSQQEIETLRELETVCQNRNVSFTELVRKLIKLVNE